MKQPSIFEALLIYHILTKDEDKTEWIMKTEEGRPLYEYFQCKKMWMDTTVPIPLLPLLWQRSNERLKMNIKDIIEAYQDEISERDFYSDSQRAYVDNDYIIVCLRNYDMNNNSDYKTRLRNEYAQLVERYSKLCAIITKHSEGTLEFKLNCSINLLERQADVMYEYLCILEERAEVENIEL